LKRFVLICVVALLLFQGTALAQQKEPLIMRVEFEWTVIGAVAGGFFGAMLWMTDPGNPNNAFAESAVNGMAWGALGGAGWGIYILQRTVVYPEKFVMAPNPAASPNISSDPVAAQMRSQDMLAVLRESRPRPGGMNLPLMNLNLRF